MRAPRASCEAAMFSRPTNKQNYRLCSSSCSCFAPAFHPALVDISPVATVFTQLYIPQVLVCTVRGTTVLSRTGYQALCTRLYYKVPRCQTVRWTIVSVPLLWLHSRHNLQGSASTDQQYQVLVLAWWCGLEYISILYFAVVSSDSQLSANLLRHPVRGTGLEHGS
eukprot:SAG31_NODE_9816_length_1223_cov_3.743772_3_plen_166_part_00